MAPEEADPFDAASVDHLKEGVEKKKDELALLQEKLDKDIARLHEKEKEVVSFLNTLDEQMREAEVRALSLYS
ncbi:hypothetical protein AGDE_14108 [Angomonas deanei]|nr:hypothetical protein AGDE_14108 [Angomonas deanei]|eukprot:EPY21415.1 hypothetical protein AGDE_14108 [Angomonas deanei]